MAMRHGSRSLLRIRARTLLAILLLAVVGVRMRLPDGPMTSHRRARLGDIDAKHTAKELGVIHVVDGVGRVVAVLELHEREATVLGCERSGMRQLAAGQWEGGRAVRAHKTSYPSAG